MVVPTNGTQIAKNSLGQLTDPNGDTLNFEKQEDGTYKPIECVVPLGYDDKGKPTGTCKYIYGLTEEKDVFTTSVLKEKEVPKAEKGEEVKPVTATAKEEKEYGSDYGYNSKSKGKK